MNRFVPGQRWLSNAEPELGLGTVLRVDSRTVQVLFAGAATTRQYAIATAPLVRVAFGVGDRIRTNGTSFVVEQVEERDGVLHYAGGGQRVPEGALDDVQNLSRCDDRLISGRVDTNAAFELRVEALARRARTRADAGYGVLSARIDLIEHQLRVAAIGAARRPPRLLLADEVGLGKTIEACLIIARMVVSGRAGRVLVLVPEALVYQWFVELKRRFNLAFAIFDAERVEAIALAGDGRNPFTDEQLVITDLDFLTHHPEQARDVVRAGWDLVVVDEAHHLAWSAEEASPEYIVVEALAKRTPGLILLTATPEQLGRSGHFARLRLLDPARFYDLDAFLAESERYVALSTLVDALRAPEPLPAAAREQLAAVLAGEDGELLACLDDDSPPTREALMRALVDRHGTGRVMFRNRRAVVGGFPRRLPQIDVLPAVADETQRAVLIEEFLGDVAKPPFSPALDYAGDARMDWLLGLLEATGKDKMLLICRTQAKLHALDEALRTRSGVAVARFHEGLGIVQRDRAAAHFAAADGARLMLCTEIGSEGRNFQFARHLVLWDLPPDPDLLEQRIGRLDRIGQRHDVLIHLAVHEGSAQAALARWYDEGLDAFRTSPEDGRTLFREFGTRVIDVALAVARGTPDAPAQLDQLIEETKARHQELAETLARGRDRLLELNTRLDPGAERLHAALVTADADLDARDFQVRLFEAYGVDVDDQGDGLILLNPEMMTNAVFPGLDAPSLATFDRSTALAREDVLFLRPDHPMLVGALDLLLSAETGNAAFVVEDTLPPRSALLEAVFVPECVAPPALGIERFLPALPERIVIDTRLGEVQDYVPDPASMRRAAERTVEVPRYSRLLRTLVPPMLATAQRRVEERLAERIARAVLQARAEVGAEIARLTNLRRVNPAVQQREIDAARDELAALEEILPQARPRLDALRFVVSMDFLKLRA